MVKKVRGKPIFYISSSENSHSLPSITPFKQIIQLFKYFSCAGYSGIRGSRVFTYPENSNNSYAEVNLKLAYWRDI